MKTLHQIPFSFNLFLLFQLPKNLWDTVIFLFISDASSCHQQIFPWHLVSLFLISTSLLKLVSEATFKTLSIFKFYWNIWIKGIQNCGDGEQFHQGEMPAVPFMRVDWILSLPSLFTECLILLEFWVSRKTLIPREKTFLSDIFCSKV